MFTRLSEFQSMSVRAFNIYTLAHAQLLIMLSIWTTKLLADASLLRPVRMLGLGKNLHLYGEQKLFALQLPKGQQFHHSRAVKVMD